METVSVGLLVTQNFIVYEYERDVPPMPQSRYLTFRVIGEERNPGSVSIMFTKDQNCGDADIYYHDGSEDDQVLRAQQGDPGVPEIDNEDPDTLTVGFDLDDTLPLALYGRTMLLYIPPECTVHVHTIMVVKPPEPNTNIPFQ